MLGLCFRNLTRILIWPLPGLTADLNKKLPHWKTLYQLQNVHLLYNCLSGARKLYPSVKIITWQFFRTYDLYYFLMPNLLWKFEMIPQLTIGQQLPGFDQFLTISVVLERCNLLVTVERDLGFISGCNSLNSIRLFLTILF